MLQSVACFCQTPWLYEGVGGQSRRSALTFVLPGYVVRRVAARSAGPEMATTSAEPAHEYCVETEHKVTARMPHQHRELNIHMLGAGSKPAVQIYPRGSGRLW